MRESLPSPSQPQAGRDLAGAELTLFQSEQRLRKILRSAPVAFATLDSEGLILDWNSEAESLFGWSRAEAVGTHLAEMILPPPIRAGYQRQIGLLLAADAVHELTRHFELTVGRRDDQEFIADLSVSRVRTEDGYLLDVFITDLTEQRQADQDRRYAEAQLQHQALHDRLTGLPNRTLLLDRVDHALSVARRQDSIAALICTDIDQFKLVNDGFGHQIGDELLVQVVTRVRDVLRTSDTSLRVGHDTVARLGGDQLGVLCEGLRTEQDALGIAERIRTALDAPFQVGDQRVFVRMSIGIAVSRSSATPGALLRDAETAMYRAKEQGGDRCEVFDPHTRARLVERVRREHELRDALDKGELRLVYQPIVSLRDAEIVGAEALVRWQHPEHGLLPPAQFISIAEESGLILPLGRWVIKQAAAQLASWIASPELRATPFRVFVNVSARQLLDDDIVGFVGRVLREQALPPSRLVLEITETSMIDDASERVGVLHQLQALDVRLALDDFGTGYSSLGYLRNLPFDCLKLDRSFVAGLGRSTTDTQIAAAAIEMARALTMTVVAEGVETEAQLNCLQRLGCHLGQGFYFADPLPSDDLPGLLRAGSWNGSVGRRMADLQASGTTSTSR